MNVLPAIAAKDFYLLRMKPCWYICCAVSGSIYSTNNFYLALLTPYIKHDTGEYIA
jgi:hypothetical protein